jgi:ribosomal protein S18 acetylase RimI-like enzyme
MEPTRIKDYSMKPFVSYLANLPKTPLVEAVQSLYELETPLRNPTMGELREFIAIASETEHVMRGDWDTNREAIEHEDQTVIEQVANGNLDAVTDGKGMVIYGENEGRMYVYMLFVKPEYRRSGVATRLMNYVKSVSGGMPVALSVNNHNDAARSLYRKIGLKDDQTFGYDGYDIIEMQSPLTESVDSMTFKTLEELRNFLDRAAYGTFENSEYDQYEQEPYGSLENIQEVGMADFVKDMSGMNHDIQSLVGQPIDDKTLNQLVYDWFVCLHTRGAVGWQYNWN